MSSPGSLDILILGAGRVGQVLARAWARCGHGVTFGARDPESSKTREVVALCGPRVRARPMAQSAEGAQIVVVATPWPQTEAVIGSVGDLNGKIVIDATNPIMIGADERSRGLLVGHTTSAAEELVRWMPGARVVKAFNTTGSANMANPRYGNHRVKVFICGDDAPSKVVTATLAAEVGLEAVDVGALKMARLLEPMALLWIELAYGQGWGPDFCFDVIRRPIEAAT